VHAVIVVHDRVDERSGLPGMDSLNRHPLRFLRTAARSVFL